MALKYSKHRALIIRDSDANPIYPSLGGQQVAGKMVKEEPNKSQQKSKKEKILNQLSEFSLLCRIYGAGQKL